jgi:hypothetical protein
MIVGLPAAGDIFVMTPHRIFHCGLDRERLSKLIEIKIEMIIE